MIENVINEFEYNNFRNKWNEKLLATFPEYESEVINFISDEKL
jgi:hypothetical protein